MPQTIREPVHDVKCLQVLHNNGGFGGHNGYSGDSGVMWDIAREQ